MEAYRIVRLDETNLRSVPETAQSFDVIGRLVPAYDGVKWTWTEEVFAQKTSKVYPAEAFAPSEYIENPKRVAFMAMRCGQCAGIIRADTRWNGNVQIEDFAVDQNHRRRGVGGMLMDALVRWGRSGGKNGVFLETQDNNLIACRFYLQYGFQLRGADTKVYMGSPYAKETALYFYLDFSVDGSG